MLGGLILVLSVRPLVERRASNFPKLLLFFHVFVNEIHQGQGCVVSDPHIGWEGESRRVNSMKWATERISARAVKERAR